MYNVKMSIARCPLERRGLELAANSIDIGTVVQQPPTRSHVRVDRRPVKRGHVLLVLGGEVKLRVLFQAIYEGLGVTPLS